MSVPCALHGDELWYGARMSRASPFSRPTVSNRSTRTALDAADYLRGHDRIAALLPTIARLNALQKECATVLPNLFTSCFVLQCEADELVLSTPNAAVAARLKQKLPYLRDALEQHGWQVKTIRLKVQVAKSVEKSRPSRRSEMPPQAVEAFSGLKEQLEQSRGNDKLRSAVEAMLARHRGKP
jgi:hypothetical protein